LSKERNVQGTKSPVTSFFVIHLHFCDVDSFAILTDDYISLVFDLFTFSSGKNFYESFWQCVHVGDARHS